MNTIYNKIQLIMSRISTEIQLLIVSILFQLQSTQKCPTEYSVRNNETYSDEVEWQFASSTSDPACLDKDEKFLTRICANGTWIPKETPKCDYVRSNLICPSNFIEFDNYCVYLTNLRTFDVGCPYPANYYMNETSIKVPVPIWLPIIRKSVVGNFEYTIVGEMYGQPLKYDELPECKTSTKNCVVYFNNSMQYADCNSLYARLCFYKKKYFALANTVRTVVCSSNCGFKDLLRNKTFDVYLKFDYEQHELLLFLYSPLLISHFSEMRQNSIGCFTDSTGDLREKLELTEKHKSLGRAFYVYQIKLIGDLVGTYWCEYRIMGNSTIITTNKVTAYKSYNGNEFALRLNLKRSFCPGCKQISKIAISNYIYQTRMQYIFGNRYRLRIMEVESLDSDIDVLIHISAMKNMNVIGEYYKLNNSFKRFQDENMNITWFRSSEFCIPTKNEYNLTWPLSALGTIVLPKELCGDDENLPITRRCAGDFQNGAYWEVPEGNCSSNFNPSETTKIIHELQFKNISNNDLKSLKNVYENVTDFNVYDIQYTTNILKHLLSFNNSTMNDDIVDCINNLLNVNRTILREAQLRLNSTDRMLDIVEELYGLDHEPEWNRNLSVLIKKNLVVQISYPNINNISGMAVYNTKNKTLKSNIIGLNYDDSIDNIDKTDLLLMVIVPKEILDNISSSQPKIAIVVYLSDNFFSSDSGLRGHSEGPVISVVIPGHGSILHFPIFIYYHNTYNLNITENHCAYWRYGLESESKQGYWSTSGGHLEFANTNYIGCSYTHLSHFAFLIMSQEANANESFQIIDVPYFGEEPSSNKWILDIIALTGCTLSLGGVAGIFLTAITFRQWREKIGTKILIELSVTISFEILLVQLSDFPLSDTLCIILGACLHYVVISKFCWMLISALLQYLRFVKIVGRLPHNLLFKANLFGWGLPILPVMFVIVFAENSYVNGYQDFCYPTGLALYLGVLLPAIVVMIANILIYMQVMHNIIVNRLESSSEIKNVQKLQIYLAVLLFFLLGIPWIFGILGEFCDNAFLRNICMYLFCLTATLQGFVLFIFYVLLDKNTRNLWIRLLNNCFT